MFPRRRATQREFAWARGVQRIVLISRRDNTSLRRQRGSSSSEGVEIGSGELEEALYLSWLNEAMGEESSRPQASRVKNEDVDDDEEMRVHSRSLD